MPINFGLKANQPPNYLKGKMVSRMNLCTISITNDIFQAGFSRSASFCHAGWFVPGETDGTPQSRSAHVVDRYAQFLKPTIIDNL